MFVPYIFHRNPYFKENTKKIDNLVQIIESNVSRGMKFSEAIKNTTYNNEYLSEDFKKIVILRAAINILKNNQNINDELKEDIRRVINDIENSLHNESLTSNNQLNNKLTPPYILGCILIIIFGVLFAWICSVFGLKIF
jgi:Fe2+ transport system protein B